MNESTPNAQAESADFEFAALAEARNYRRAIVEEISPFLGRRVIEVGAGVGQITEAVHGHPGVEEVLAVEPDPRFHYGHQSKPWKLLDGTSRGVSPEDGWDTAVLINVLEHIEDDEDELAWLRTLLSKARGHVCLLVPARPELYAPIDKDFGHFRRYTCPGLTQKLQAAGFSVCRCDYLNWAGYFAWLIAMKMFGKRTFSVNAVRFYDRCIFPWVHWSERNLMRPPFGQSLIAVGRADP